MSFQVGGMEELDGLLENIGGGAVRGIAGADGVCGLGIFGGVAGGLAGSFGGICGSDCGGGRKRLVFAGGGLVERRLCAGLEREDVLFAGDALGFRVHQPLRASGGMRLRVPTGRTRYGELTWREVSGGPSGRELIWEGLYRRSAEEGDWLLSAGVISQPGHRADAKTLGRALLAFERAF